MFFPSVPLGTYHVTTRDGMTWTKSYPYKLVERHKMWNAVYGDTMPLTLDKISMFESPPPEMAEAERKTFLDKMIAYHKNVLRMYGHSV